jgi:hypothetical protein
MVPRSYPRRLGELFFSYSPFRPANCIFARQLLSF